MELERGYIYVIKAFNPKICERKPKAQGFEENVIYKKEIRGRVIGGLIDMTNPITRLTW